MMKKFLIGATLCLITALLLAGLYDPESPLLWVASSSIGFAYLRTALIVVLLVLLFTNPPRRLFLRACLMIFGIILGFAVVQMALTYTLNFLDAVVLLEVSIIAIIEGLESEIFAETTLVDRLVLSVKRGVRMLAQAIANGVKFIQHHPPVPHQ
jgi:hypothetical protein